MTEDEFTELSAPMQREAPCFSGSLAFTVELAMGLDGRGRYFQQFDPSLPHELGGGKWTDREETDGLVRYGAIVVGYTERPYCEAVQSLGEDLEALWQSVIVLGEPELLAGRRKIIRRR